MDRLIRNAILAIGTTLQDLMCGRVPHDHARRRLAHSLDEIEQLGHADAPPETDVTKHGQLLKEAEEKIVDQQTTIGTQKTTIDGLTTDKTALQAQVDQLTKDKADLQTQLAAAGKPVDPSTVLDADDMSEEATLGNLLNPPAPVGGNGSGTSGASAPLNPAPGSAAATAPLVG